MLLLLIAIVFACYTTWWLIAQCWQPKCYIIVIVLFVLLTILVVCCFCLKESRDFFINIQRDNSFWKVTQCKEVIGRKENKSVRRLSDVPTIQRLEVKNGMNFFKENTNGEAHLNLDDSHSFSPHSFLEENMPSVRAPRDYPHIKKVVECKRRDISMVLTDNYKNVPELNLVQTNSFSADNNTNLKLQLFDDNINVIHSDLNCNKDGSLKNDNLTNVNSVDNRGKSFYNHLTTKLGKIFTVQPVINLSQEAVIPFETDIEFKTLETGVTYHKPETYINDHNIKQFQKNVYKQTEPSENNSVETEVQKRYININSLTVYNGPQDKYYLYEESYNIFPRLPKDEENHNTFSKSEEFQNFFTESRRIGQNKFQEEVSSVSNEVKQIFI